MLAFLGLFFIVIATVGIVAYIYLSEEYRKWVISFFFCLFLISVFVYVRSIDIVDYALATDTELKLIYFKKEALSVASFWCTAIIIAMTLVSLPKKLEKLKNNKLPIFSIVLFTGLLLFVWRM